DLIVRNGSMTAGALANLTGLTTGAITGVVDRLERAGMARRVPDPDDRRRVKLEVTPEFYARADTLWGPLKADWESTLAERFSAAELERIIEFLRATNAVG